MIRRLPSRQVVSVTAFAADDGTFTFISVPEGRYELTAIRKVPTPGVAAFGSNGAVALPMDDVIDSDPDDLLVQTTLEAGDSDITGLTLTMEAGTMVRGRIFFGDPGVISDRQFGGFGITLKDLGRELFTDGRSGQAARPDREGVVRFSIRAQPGEYRLGGGFRGPQDWWVESTRVDGRDVGIGPFRIGPRDVDLEVTFTRTPTELSGSVTDAQARPVLDANVLIFPTDPALWRNAASELSFRVDSPVQIFRTGKSTYAVTGLPPGEYFVAAIDEAEMDGWPSEAFLDRARAAAVRVQLAPGEHRTQPLTVRVRR